MCNINPAVWQLIRDNFPINEEETWSNTYVVLKKDAGNTKDLASKLWVSFNKKWKQRTFKFEIRKKQLVFLEYLWVKWTWPIWQGQDMKKATGVLGNHVSSK